MVLMRSRDEAPGFVRVFKQLLSSEKLGLRFWNGGQRQEDTERAYDIADSLEKGLAREITSDFQHPLKRSKSLWKFRVLRSEDKLQYRLFSQGGDFLMYASACPKDHRISLYMYDPQDPEQADLFDPSRPAFTMNFSDDNTEWRLVEEQCELCRYNSRQHCCCSKHEVARIRHHQERLGDGIFNNMEIDLPGLCPWTGASMKACQEEFHEAPARQTLVTRMPVWNDEVDSLVMDFKGRHVLSSSKNFQLVSPAKPSSVVCQYAKIGHSAFGLDFKFPLSVVQAFGISLTSLLWK